MKLFEFKNYVLTVSEETWGLSAFNTLLKRDKSKGKEKAHKEMLFVFYFCDIKSDYLGLKEEARVESIKKDIGLPEKWTYDDDMKAACDLYLSGISVIERLYRQTLTSVIAIGSYLENTEALLNERDDRGKHVTDISKITASVQKVPKLMADIKAAYKEVVKEQEDTANKKKGSRQFNLYEDGL